MAPRFRHEASGGMAFIDEYRYDLPFYLRDASPVLVVANWDSAEVQRHDNWRREVGDAAGFASELAARRLVGVPGFRAALCAVRWPREVDRGSSRRCQALSVPQRRAASRNRRRACSLAHQCLEPAMGSRELPACLASLKRQRLLIHTGDLWSTRQLHVRELGLARSHLGDAQVALRVRPLRLRCADEVEITR